VDADEERAAWEWLHNVDDAYLACHGQHAFPKLIARNGRLPRGISAEPVPQRVGHFQIKQKCRDCGLPRYFTVEGDLFAPRRSYQYGYDELAMKNGVGYRMPKNATRYIKHEDIARERWRRAAEALGLTGAQ
jgi:hypothetical protein